MSFDLKMIDSGMGKPYEAEKVKIVGSDGSVVSIYPSSSSYSPAGSWTRCQVALTPAVFGAREETFLRVMRSVDRVMIRGEYSDRSDVEGIDNVMVILPIVTELISCFDHGDEDWRGVGTSISPGERWEEILAASFWARIGGLDRPGTTSRLSLGPGTGPPTSAGR